MNRIVKWLLFFFLMCFSMGCRFIGGAGDQVCFRQHCYHVEIADDDMERMRGLQNRTTLFPDAGMLFIFPESERHAFWMKDTLIPLDMIWLDSSRKVVHIESNVPPCRKDPCPTYTPATAALYVLELNAGQAASRGITLGDKAEYHWN